MVLLSPWPIACIFDCDDDHEYFDRESVPDKSCEIIEFGLKKDEKRCSFLQGMCVAAGINNRMTKNLNDEQPNDEESKNVQCDLQTNIPYTLKPKNDPKLF